MSYSIWDLIIFKNIFMEIILYFLCKRYYSFMLLCYVCHHTIIFFPEINVYFKYLHNSLWARIDILILNILWDSQFGDKVILCTMARAEKKIVKIVYLCPFTAKNILVSIFANFVNFAWMS